MVEEYYLVEQKGRQYVKDFNKGIEDHDDELGKRLCVQKDERNERQKKKRGFSANPIDLSQASKPRGLNANYPNNAWSKYFTEDVIDEIVKNTPFKKP